MQPESSSTVYEVRCYECEVSFPVGTKRCMYCGNRPGQRSLFSRELAPDPMIEFAPLGDLDDVDESVQPRPVDFEEDEDEQQPRSPLSRILGSFSWVILFVIISLYRFCAGQ